MNENENENGTGGRVQAGIRLAMVTGDHPTTAKAIARIIGLISMDSVTPDELDKLRIVAPADASRRSHDNYTVSQKNVTLFIFVISLSNFIRFC